MIQTYELIERENTRFIRIPQLQEAGLSHVFTTNDWDMAVGMGRNGDHSEVKANYEMICRLLEVEPEALYFMHQVHSDWVSVVEEPELGREYPFGHRVMDVDGLATGQKNFVLSSSFADCIPVLLYDPVVQAQVNLHSGWRGTVAKICRNGVQILCERFGSKPENILAGLGPHIRQEHYEVKIDVVELFQGAFANYQELIREEDGRFTVDLTHAVESVLMESGLREEHIFDCGLSTYDHPELLHSYRRDRDQFGMMVAVSCLKNI